MARPGMRSGQVIERAGIALCLICMLIAPWFSDPGYDWLAHTTSELSGQGMPHSWIMRIGFLSFGTGILLSALPRDQDGPAIHVGKAGFGMAMIGTAIWSSAPIEPG